MDLSMDTLNKSPSPAPGPDIAGDALLPTESALSMVPCRLDQGTLAKRRPARIETALALRRLFVFVGTALLTAAGGCVKYGVFEVRRGAAAVGIILCLFLLLAP